MMDSTTRRASDREEFNLRDLLLLLSRNRWRAATFVAVCTVAVALLSWLITPTYTATTVLSPVSSAPGSGSLGNVGSALSQLGGLASLAGIAGSGDTRKSESVAVLRSQALTEDYIKQNDLLPVLYARLWDAREKRWTVSDARKMPTLWKANRYLNEKLRTITIEPKTGLVTMTISWRDPQVAATWANGLVAMANSYLRQKAIVESERNIEYLNAEAAKTDVVGVKQAIYAILQTEISKQMLARGSEEYAFKVLDPAIAPEKPSFPQMPLWIAAAVIGSTLLTVFAGYAWLAWLRP